MSAGYRWHIMPRPGFRLYQSSFTNRDYSRTSIWGRSRTCESELPVQLGCTERSEPSGSVLMRNPGRVHWRSARNHNILGDLRPHNENFWSFVTINQN